jgi:hypothetical protein
MDHIKKLQAIQFIRANAIFNLEGDNLIWLDENQIMPTDKEIEQGLIDYEKMQDQVKAQKAAAKAALLSKIGISEDEARLLLE